MLPCRKGCIYKENIAGNCHIGCSFDWIKHDLKNIPTADRGQQWFHFPLNFDVVWGPDKCTQQSDKITKPKRETSPMENIMALCM